ncbi:hypothetical protein TZ02_08155 [Clostridium aceticum]|nr:hypothetical protein TZ02_08155 [Clostridium aceticum]
MPDSSDSAMKLSKSFSKIKVLDPLNKITYLGGIPMTIFRVNLLKFLKKGDIKALKELINGVDIIKLTHVFKQLKPEEQAIVFKHLKKERALQVFEGLGRERQSILLKHLSRDKVRRSTAKVHAINNSEIMLQDAYDRRFYPNGQ